MWGMMRLEECDDGVQKSHSQHIISLSLNSPQAQPSCDIDLLLGSVRSLDPLLSPGLCLDGRRLAVEQSKYKPNQSSVTTQYYIRPSFFRYCINCPYASLYLPWDMHLSTSRESAPSPHQGAHKQDRGPIAATCVAPLTAQRPAEESYVC